MGLERSATDEEFTPPQEFDGFRVVRPLGRGGMGHVYLGRDLALDRAVALKFIAAALPNSSARERFLIEARAIARLQHPNVVGVYRVGDVTGNPYLAYEFVAGSSLDKLPRPMPWTRALEIGIGVARGLAAAHRRDVLHRDVKPANVMITDTGEVKILDFGLAKLRDTSASGQVDSSQGWIDRVPSDVDASMAITEMMNAEARAGGRAALTATGQFLGTPLYMAPELWRGDLATEHSDIYAVGLVLYELLTGRLPHGELRADELARAVVSEDLPPVAGALAGRGIEVPQALADVVDRCVRRRRDARFPSADRLVAALEAVQVVYTPFASNDVTSENADDAVLVGASFSRITGRADAFATSLYARLFDHHPEVKPLFSPDLTEQRKKLMGALQLVVENLKKPERLVPLLEDLGRRHALYKVEAGHFDAIGEALLGTLAEFDRAHFTPETERAWARAYGSIAEAMQRGLADERPTPAPTAFDKIAYQKELVFDPPRTRYASNDGASIAYQAFGAGPEDLVLCLGWVTHLEIGWQSPELARFLRRLASAARVILFDKRGTGLSDPLASKSPSLADRTSDVRAVMDAVGSARATIFGVSDGAALAAAFAASAPDRVRSLVLYGGSPCGTAATGYEHGLPPDAIEGAIQEISARWGEPVFLEHEAPSVAHDDAFKKWWASYLRSGASPGAASALLRVGSSTDVRELLPKVSAPALVLHRAGDRLMPIAGGRDFEARLPFARFVELAGDDHIPFVGASGALLDEVTRFVASLG